MQPALFERVGVEIRLRFGVLPEADHLQWMVEVIEVPTDILRGASSMPHARLVGVADEIEAAIAVFRDVARDAVDPF